MPTARARRTVAADPAAVWAVVGDPRRLPEWWPKVERVEGVSGRAFTTVLLSKRGREVRADQRLLAEDHRRRRAWALELDGTPFERVFALSETEVKITPAEGDGGGGTLVELALRQRMRGASRLGSPLLWRASRAQLREALDALDGLLSRGAAGR